MDRDLKCLSQTKSWFFFFFFKSNFSNPFMEYKKAYKADLKKANKQQSNFCGGEQVLGSGVLSFSLCLSKPTQSHLWGVPGLLRQ